LDVQQRQWIALAFYRGLSHQDIAEYTGEPLGTVKTVLRRAQAILRAALTDSFPDRGMS
jgi:RNA polymerase sigma-70 factor (ECF subfamily)